MRPPMHHNFNQSRMLTQPNHAPSNHPQELCLRRHGLIAPEYLSADDGNQFAKPVPATTELDHLNLHDPQQNGQDILRFG